MAVALRNFHHPNPNAENFNPTDEMHPIHFQPKLRYFAVGPNTRIVKCPVCGTRCELIEKNLANLKEVINGILCCFSCCFPIFWASCAYVVLTRLTKRKRLCCSACAAQLGFYRCPS